MLKSLDVTGLIGDADGARFDRDPSTGRIRIWFPDSAENKWYELPEMSQCHRVIACLGWRFDTSIFNDATLPRMKTDQYPLLTPEYESINVPGLFFAGTLMHSRDKPRSSGGFIHGFRWVARCCDVLWTLGISPQVHDTMLTTALVLQGIWSAPSLGSSSPESTTLRGRRERFHVTRRQPLPNPSCGDFMKCQVRTKCLATLST